LGQPECDFRGHPGVRTTEIPGTGGRGLGQHEDPPAAGDWNVRGPALVPNRFPVRVDHLELPADRRRQLHVLAGRGDRHPRRVGRLAGHALRSGAHVSIPVRRVVALQPLKTARGTVVRR
jgi:hypothetical protein